MKVKSKVKSKSKIHEKIKVSRFKFDDIIPENTENEDDNVSVEACKKSISLAENVNPMSKWHQKREIKKQYIKPAYGQVGTWKQRALNGIKYAFSDVGKSVLAVVKKPQIAFALAIILFLTLVVTVMFYTGSVIFEGAMKNVIFTSYTSENLDIVETDLYYTKLEEDLENKIDNIENDYTGYDEYRYYLDDIEHNAHELASFLTAYLQTYDVEVAKAKLREFFAKMYKLKLETIVEVRSDSEGNTYYYYILEVTLKNRGVDAVARELLTPAQLEMYEIYLETEGNKNLVFGGGSYNKEPSTDLNGVVLVDGKRLGNENTVRIALSQVGNVGGEPYWSWYGFESRVPWCACFVSWVLDKAGYSSPTFAACQYQGVPYFVEHGRWANSSYTDIAPGDVIFFDWERDGHSDHVGIVIGSDGKRVYVVEGNSYDVCKVRDYSLDSGVIMGYGLMN